MKKSAFSGPVITLGAAAALRITLFSTNVVHEEESAPPRPAPFPAKVKYHSDIATKKGNLTLDIKVNGAKASGYACDNYGIEEWLGGTAVDGVVTMMSTDGKSGLTGRREGSTVVGNLSIGDKQWAFTVRTVQGYQDV